MIPFTMSYKLPPPPSSTAELTALKAQVLELQASLAAIGSQLDECGHDVSGLQSEIAAATQVRLELEAEIVSLNTQIQMLQEAAGNSNAELQAQLASCTTGKASLESQVVSLTTQINDLNAQVTTLNSDKATLQTQVNGLNAQITGLNGQITTLNSDKATLQTQVNSLNAQITTLNSDKATLQTQVNDLNAQITTLNSDKAALQAQVTTLQAQVGVRAPLIDLNLSNCYKDMACTQLAAAGDVVKGWKSGTYIFTNSTGNPLTTNGINALNSYICNTAMNLASFTMEITVFGIANSNRMNIFSIKSSNVDSILIDTISLNFSGVLYNGIRVYVYDYVHTAVISTTINVPLSNTAPNVITVKRNYDTITVLLNGSSVTSGLTNYLLYPFSSTIVGGKIGSNTTPLYTQAVKIWDYVR